MEYFNIKISQKIHNFFQRTKSHYYAFLVELHQSKDKELNALLISQLIVITILGLIVLGILI